MTARPRVPNIVFGRAARSTSPSTRQRPATITARELCIRGQTGGRDEHQALHALGERDRELGGDEPAHRVADDRRGVYSELVEQTVQQARIARDRDSLARHGGVAEAGEVHRDHTVLAAEGAIAR